ncbi:MAG: hypothetical protein EAZ37_16075 [Burkholderiales bacterium]|nr:MAG: hypothetical protein EAZ43_16175 [Betaproteobacteria bacterium]TAG24519.1 MAG: hypothetical protein EAZ37_16075 [Burkholderiales bacterium]
MSLIAATLATASLAIVTSDNSALRAAPRESAAQHVALSQGDMLEIRGTSLDYLKVYDHRRERAGFVKASLVKQTRGSMDEAAELLVSLGHIRDTQGSDALGVALFAAYAKIAPAKALDAEAFDLLGTFAERIANRVNNANKTQMTLAMQQLDTAAFYGVKMKSFEIGGRIRYCYDGEAFRRVLAIAPRDASGSLLRARAALALTHPACIDPNEHPATRRQLESWRADVLEQVDASMLPDYMRSRIALRRAAVWSSVAFHAARNSVEHLPAAERAVNELAKVDKQQVADEDQSAHDESAVRIGAMRWMVESAAKPSTKLTIQTRAGEPGQTCVQIISPDKRVLIERCTYGVAHLNSASINASGTAVALAVQPLDAWRELWVFQKDNDLWRIDVLPPSSHTRDIGYVEFAGWVPGGKQLLVAREHRADGRFRKSFELLRLDTLNVEKTADAPSSINAFYRWQDPVWKKQTVALR